MTLREYAKRCETTHQTVSSAIKKGDIVEGIMYDSAGNPRIKVDAADMEWGISFMERKAIERIKKSGVDDEEISDEELEVIANNDDIPYSTKLNELFRLEMLFKARIQKMKAHEMAGTLVQKEAVYRDLFKKGKEIRERFESLPDRIIDELIVMCNKGRDEAKLYLFNEISTVLELLADGDSN